MPDASSTPEVNADPVKLYFWPQPNFGDQLSARVVAHVAGRPVMHRRPAKAQMVAIGSLMHVVAKFYGTAQAHRPIIWGTGVRHAQHDKAFLDHVDIRLLRGPMSAAYLGLKHARFGDPGLLAPDAIGRPAARADRIAIVPHHTQIENDGYCARLDAITAADPRLAVIDVRDDPDTVCLAIASAAHVFASSLHGLIVADAYGVANTWMSPGRLGWAKYHDYAASIGRILPAPCALEDVTHLAGQAPTNAPVYGDGIDTARAALLETFPDEMRAAATPSTHIV